MSVTGLTENKLFKVRTLNPNNPYQVGVNGVIDIVYDDLVTKIKYEIDDIIYTTYIDGFDKTFNDGSLPDNRRVNFLDIKTSNVIRDSDGTYDITKKDVTGVNKKYSVTSYNNRLKTIKTGSKFFNRDLISDLTDDSLGDTIYETKKFSFNNFVSKNIYKNNKYIGLISKPIVKSDIYLERDEYSIHERQQRLSEINSLAELFNYRNGYYVEIKTL